MSSGVVDGRVVRFCKVLLCIDAVVETFAEPGVVTSGVLIAAVDITDATVGAAVEKEQFVYSPIIYRFI